MEKMNDTKALAVIPRSLPEVQEMAKALAKSNLLPDALKGKEADVMVQILAGQELGMAPMASIRGVHIVQGKPLLSADTMVALVLGSGLCEYFSLVEETATQVTYETKRNGSPTPARATWSDQDTKDAGLNTKDNWRLHKKQMRRARARAILARDVYPDVLAGCYDPDEIAVPIRERQAAVNDDAIDAEIVSTEVTLPPEFDAIEATDSVDACKALVAKGGPLADTMRALTAEQRTIANERYGAQLKKLREQTGAA